LISFEEEGEEKRREETQKRENHNCDGVLPPYELLSARLKYFSTGFNQVELHTIDLSEY
jgi:hypothetical protein